MTEGKIGFFSALWRFISFYEARKALGLVRAADRQFTGSAAGISDAYDIHHEALIKEYNSFFDALSQVETALEMKRDSLKSLQAKIKDKKKLVNGALAECDRAEAKGDAEALQQAEQDGRVFQSELKKLEDEEKALIAELEAEEANLKQLEDQLGDMQKKIKDLPKEKAEQIAKFVSNKALIDAYERINGLKSRLDRGPIDAVIDSNNQLAAKARVAGRLNNAATTDRDAKYRTAAEDSDASSDFDKLRAARKAEREAKEGTNNQNTNERPNII